MSDVYSIIKGPVITEKSAMQGTDTQSKVAFWVDLKSSKNDIKRAIEELFSVKVDSINTMRIGGKVKRMGRYAGRTSTRKKAYITLKEGENIEGLFGGA
jgi:large subunit ribosomal protein L23